MAKQPVGSPIRRTLELLRDELRLRSLKFDDLRHEKLTSQLPVSPAGWASFSNEHRNDNDSEHWQVDRSGEGVGRFYGELEGLSIFQQFSRVFLQVTGRSLIDITHDVATLQATPLLELTPVVWNWEPDEHIHEDGYVMDVDPYLEEWDERSIQDMSFPCHALVRQLKGSVFYCAAVAVELLLDPTSLFLRPFDMEELPLSVAGFAEEEAHSCEATQNISATESESDFKFKQQGDAWHLRYVAGNTVEEATFSDAKWLGRFATLLQRPNFEMPCLEFDVSNRNGDTVATTDLSEEGCNDQKLDRHELQEVRKHISELEEMLHSTTDQDRQKGLRQELRRLQRSSYVGREATGLESHAQQAARRIKKSFHDGCSKLRKNGMVQLSMHLESFVLPEGYTYVYRPDREINWSV